MRTAFAIVAGVALGIAAARGALAHHSAAQFDFQNPVPVEGTVKLVEVRNPHIRLVLEVAREDGSVRDVEFEGHSRNNVYRRGWRPDLLDVGHHVTIRIAPMRDGTDGGYVTAFTLDDGTKF